MKLRLIAAAVIAAHSFQLAAVSQAMNLPIPSTHMSKTSHVSGPMDLAQELQKMKQVVQQLKSLSITIEERSKLDPSHEEHIAPEEALSLQGEISKKLEMIHANVTMVFEKVQEAASVEVKEEA